MKEHRGVEGAVPVRRHAGPDKHLHASTSAVRRCGEVCIVGAAAIQSLGIHRVVSDTSAAKIIHLEVPCRLREAEFIHAVMHEIRPVKDLCHGCILVGRRFLGGVHREVKHASRASCAWQVGHVVCVGIRVGIRVIAPRDVVAVIDPAVRRSCGIQSRGRHQYALDLCRLKAGGCLMARRHRVRAVSGVHSVAGVANECSQRLAHQHFRSFRIHQHPVHFRPAPAGQCHIPGQAHAALIHRHPGQLCVCVRQQRRTKLLPPVRLRGGRSHGPDGCRRHIVPHVLSRCGDGFFDGQHLQGRTGGCRRIRHELAADVDQFRLRRQVGLEHGFKHIDPLMLLVPDHLSRRAALGRVVSDTACNLQGFGTVTENCTMRFDETPDGCIGVRARLRTGQQSGVGCDPFRRLADRVEIHADTRDLLPQRIQRPATHFRRLGISFAAHVEVGKRFGLCLFFVGENGGNQLVAGRLRCAAFCRRGSGLVICWGSHLPNRDH